MTQRSGLAVVLRPQSPSGVSVFNILLKDISAGQMFDDRETSIWVLCLKDRVFISGPPCCQL